MSMDLFGKGSEACFLFEIQGAPKVEVVDFEAYEGLSEPFIVNVTLAVLEEIPFDDVMQQEALLTIRSNGRERYFHGIVIEFGYIRKSGLIHLPCPDRTACPIIVSGTGLPHFSESKRPGHRGGYLQRKQHRHEPL